jgi:hypothetical protein
MIRIIDELPGLLEEQGIASVGELIGSLNWPSRALPAD